MNCLKILVKLLTQDSSNFSIDMKKYTLIIGLLLVFQGFAQETSKGDKKYDNFAYIDAIDIYERVANKGYKSKDLFEKLANAYYFNGMLEKSEKWFEQLFELKEELDPEYYFRYSQALKSVKKYDKADKMMEKFYQLTNDYRGELYIKNKLYLKDLHDNSEKYKVEDAGVNSPESDYGAAFLNKKMYFASSRKFSKSKEKTDKWTNQNYTNLLSASFDEKGNPVYLDEITDELNTKFHEASATFTNDGLTMYFTRNNYLNGKKGLDVNKTMQLKIYKAIFKNNEWQDIVELPFNNENYSTAHPCLSKDEKFLFFASDMPGGYGSSDLYKVAINNDGTFGEPINLGSKINTKARETFPFIDSDNNLYFATDGHPGFGGLDIFKSTINSNGNFESFENLGQPINSEKDDFAFVKSPFDKIGFVSSNRDGGKGFDDIYKFIELPEPPKKVIEDVILDAITNEPIVNAKISVFDANKNLIKETSTDKDGNFKIDELRKDRDYYITVDSKEHFPKEVRINGSDNSSKINTKLDPKYIVIKPGTDIVKALGITIYFDLDKYFITKDAEVELAKIIEVMIQHPQIKVAIGSHTDSRQSESYNLRLSNFRAKSTRDYLIKKGISPERLTAKGYGETQLLNDCKDGVPCSNDQHQLNRRSEFIVVE